MIYRIGTRGSNLALAQTNFVKARLEKAFPNDTFEVVVISTRGDRVVNRSIASLNDTALFTREIERALLEKEIDIAVHSMKDLSSNLPEGLALARAWPREDPRDVLVSCLGKATLDELPQRSLVATGSPRRSIQLKRLRPDLNLADIRGNVETRLRKLFEPDENDSQFDAIVLAAAGLKRLGLSEHVSQYFSVDEMVPAANQGFLAIELRSDDRELLNRLNELGDDEAELIATAERQFLSAVGADCHMPIGAHATIENGEITLRVVYARNVEETPRFARVTGRSPAEVAERAVREISRPISRLVTLVGAGPGDPDLITLKALRAIREADVIIYDRLVSDEILKEAKPGCEKIYVGKASGNHTLPQDEINDLLICKANEFQRVVRLKGGDPFVFGRGGEEIGALVQNAIPYELIPGVTSAVAAPEAFGIPVTHRGIARGLTILTAHAKNDEPLDIDFTRLTDESVTLVFLMGLTRLKEIVSSLLRVGRSPETPVAAIQSATMPDAKIAVGTLATIVERADAANISTPATVVVGEVVRLRERFGFPLSSRRILLPQIGKEKTELARRLESRGAAVETLPVGKIEVLPYVFNPENFQSTTWLAFTSRNATKVFPAKLLADIRAKGVKFAAIGSTTAAALKERGIEADFISSEQTGNGMVRELSERVSSNDVVLHPMAEGVTSPLAELSKICSYKPLAVYRNVAVPVKKAIDLSKYDGVVFTCASSAQRLMPQTTGETKFFAIGPATADALQSLGVSTVATAQSPSADALAELVAKTFHAPQKR